MLKEWNNIVGQTTLKTFVRPNFYETSEFRITILSDGVHEGRIETRSCLDV